MHVLNSFNSSNNKKRRKNDEISFNHFWLFMWCVVKVTHNLYTNMVRIYVYRVWMNSKARTHTHTYVIEWEIGEMKRKTDIENIKLNAHKWIWRKFAYLLLNYCYDRFSFFFSFFLVDAKVYRWCHHHRHGYAGLCFKKDKLIVWRNSIELIQQLCHRHRRRSRRCSINIKITRQRTIHAIWCVVETFY